MNNWDDEERFKPRIVEFVESFERKYKDAIPEDLITPSACLGVALYLFGPLEDEELDFYGLLIKARLDQYRESVH